MLVQLTPPLGEARISVYLWPLLPLLTFGVNFLLFCLFVIFFFWDFIPLGFLPYQLLIPRITTLPLASWALAMFECEKGGWWCAARLRLISGKEVEVQWDTSHLLEVEDVEVFVWRSWTLLLPSVIFSAPLARVSQEKGKKKCIWNHGWFSAKPLHSWPWRRVTKKEMLQDYRNFCSVHFSSSPPFCV